MADYSVTFLESGTPDTSRNPSPAIWGDCNWLDIERREFAKQGVSRQDEFTNFPSATNLAPTLTTQVGIGSYKGFATASSNILGVSAVNSVDLGGGILEFLVDASTHSASLADPYGNYKISGDPATSGKFWFECRIALGSITTLHAGLFVGLAETDPFVLATGVPFSSNTGAAITNAGSMLGFNKPAANTTTLSTVRSDRATTFTTIGSGEVTGLTAFGFTKLGIKYDPLDPFGRHLRFFQDNVELTTYLTNTTILATTNLKANSLGLMIAVVGGSAASSDLVFLDWWRVAQYAPGVR